MSICLYRIDPVSRLGVGVLVLVASVLAAGCPSVGGGKGAPVPRDLPEVRFVGPKEQTVSLQDLRAGIEIPVEIVVKAAAWRASPLDTVGCQLPDKNGLILFPVVHRGPDLVYCPACDIGYCAHPYPSDTAVPRPGVYRYIFRWHGEQGLGSSHYARTLDPRESSNLEPGEYRVTVTTAFTSASPEGMSLEGRKVSRKSDSSLVIRVVP